MLITDLLITCTNIIKQPEGTLAGIGKNVTPRVYQCQWSILIVDMVKEQLLNSSKQFNIHAFFFGVALMQAVYLEPKYVLLFSSVFGLHPCLCRVDG